MSDVHYSTLVTKDKNIQVLRGIAILMVLSYHAEPDIFTIGYLGVDFFFVISGWLLAPKILEIWTSGKNFSNSISLYKRYCVNRLRRILPALFFSLLFTLPIVVLTTNVGSDLSRTLKQLLFSVIFVSNISAPGLAGDYYSPNPNHFLHLWSLSIEMQTYLFVPLFGAVLLFCIQGIFKRNLALYITLFAFEAVLLLIANKYESFYYSLSLRAAEFLCGAITWQIMRGSRALTGKTHNLEWPVRRFVYFIFFWMLFSLTLFTPDGLGLQICATAVACALLAGTRIKKKLKVKTESRYMITYVLQWFGEISYPLYLIHFPILVSVKHSNLDVFSFRDRRDLVTLIAVLISILLARYIHNKYEFVDSFNLPNFLKLMICVGSFAIIILFFNSHKFLGFNYHDLKPEKSGDKIYLECNFNEQKILPCITSPANSLGRIGVIGDSHAVALSEGIQRVFGSEFTIESWVSSGCKYLDPDILKNKARFMASPSDDCLQRNRNFKRAAIRNSYDAIFVAARSQNCNYNDFYGICGDLFIESTLNSIDILQQFTKETWLIGPSLELVRGSNYLVDRSIFGKFIMPPRTFLFSEIEQQVIRDLAIVEAQEEKFLSPIRIFCDLMKCQNSVHGEFVLADSSHLSNKAGFEVANKLKKILTNE